jgi:hypothetical protein
MTWQEIYSVSLMKSVNSLLAHSIENDESADAEGIEFPE